MASLGCVDSPQRRGLPTPLPTCFPLLIGGRKPRSIREGAFSTLMWALGMGGFSAKGQFGEVFDDVDCAQADSDDAFG